MKFVTAILLVGVAGWLGCSGPVACGAVKRLMYEEPWRDWSQKKSAIVAALDLKPGAQVADLGAGGGYFTYPLAEAVGESGRVYAIDIDTDLLAYVAHQADKRGLPQIETVVAPPDGLGIAENSVDLIFLSHVFHHLPDQTQYFSNARSQLRPNGRVAVLEAAGRGFPKGHATSPDEIREKLESAGFVRTANHEFVDSDSFQIFAVRDAE